MHPCHLWEPEQLAQDRTDRATTSLTPAVVLDDDEPGRLEDCIQLSGRPTVGRGHGVIEGLDRAAVEVAEQQGPAGLKNPRELSDRDRDVQRFVVNGREPGQDAAQSVVGFVDRVNAPKPERHTWIGSPRVFDEFRNQVDPADVGTASREKVGPVPGSAPRVEETPGYRGRPCLDEVDVGVMHRVYRSQRSRVLDRMA